GRWPSGDAFCRNRPGRGYRADFPHLQHRRSGGRIARPRHCRRRQRSCQRYRPWKQGIRRTAAWSEQLPLGEFGDYSMEMLIGGGGGYPAAGGPIEKSILNQEGFIDILDGIAFLTDGCGDGIQADRAATELVDNRQQDHAVHLVETLLVDLQQF